MQRKTIFDFDIKFSAEFWKPLYSINFSKLPKRRSNIT